MAYIPGYGTAIGVIFRIIDTLWPTKKEALAEELEALESQYYGYLLTKQDTKASETRKKMEILRKRIAYASE